MKLWRKREGKEREGIGSRKGREQTRRECSERNSEEGEYRVFPRFNYYHVIMTSFY